MTSKPRANLAILAALLVLFSALLSPIISALIAFLFLIALAIYEYRAKT